jgi:hypothetical protein
MYLKDFIFLIKEISKGKSVTRSFLNVRLSKDTLVGSTIDIGGGKNADYISFMNREKDVEFVGFDIKAGAVIDFEKDELPARDGQYDTVLFLNVMEHIYNYQHIANEVVRITKNDGGRLIGFVPFLMWYHPDHHDYFRYTHESLKRILREAGGVEINVESISMGPFVAASHMILQSFPKVVRIIVFVPLFLLDCAYLYFRPTHGNRFALGYYFSVKK